PKRKLIVKIESVRDERHGEQKPSFGSAPTQHGQQGERADTGQCRSVVRRGAAYRDEPAPRPVWPEQKRDDEESCRNEDIAPSWSPREDGQPDVRLEHRQAPRSWNQRERQNERAALCKLCRCQKRNRQYDGN